MLLATQIIGVDVLGWKEMFLESGKQKLGNQHIVMTVFRVSAKCSNFMVLHMFAISSGTDFIGRENN